MASNYTPNYSLCQWQASDKVLRTEFNADNAKIDAALAEKAPASTVRSLQSTVSGLQTGKADKSALDSLSAVVSGHTASLGKKGNCVLYTTSYTGNGQYGSASATRTLTFPGEPLLVAIAGERGFMLLLRGVGEAVAVFPTQGYTNNVTWNGSSVSWYSAASAGSYMMNSGGTVYQVAALMKAD